MGFLNKRKTFFSKKKTCPCTLFQNYILHLFLFFLFMVLSAIVKTILGLLLFEFPFPVPPLNHFFL